MFQTYLICGNNNPKRLLNIPYKASRESAPIKADRAHIFDLIPEQYEAHNAKSLHTQLTYCTQVRHRSFAQVGISYRRVNNLLFTYRESVRLGPCIGCNKKSNAGV